MCSQGLLLSNEGRGRGLLMALNGQIARSGSQTANEGPWRGGIGRLNGR